MTYTEGLTWAWASKPQDCFHTEARDRGVNMVTRVDSMEQPGKGGRASCLGQQHGRPEGQINHSWRRSSDPL
jgi:hypothetical protein